MTARIIDGKAVARKLRAEYAVRVEKPEVASTACSRASP